MMAIDADFSACGVAVSIVLSQGTDPGASPGTRLFFCISRPTALPRRSRGAPAAQAVALNDRIWSRRRLNKRV
eukprot:67120-Chlamydomonas_euryale.AAC.1